MKAQQGFSIIEFMISITLGALLIAAVGVTYISNKTTHGIQDGLARLQENARYAAYLLAREIRMAGYIGCANQQQISINNVASFNANLLDISRPIEGIDGLSGTFSPSLPSYLTGMPRSNSDVIILRMGSSLGVQLRDNMNRTNNPILVHDRLGIQAGDPVLITNCVIGDIFIAGANSNATAITHTVTNNSSNDLSIAYLSDSQIMRFLHFAYYVKDTGRTNSQGEPVYALVRYTISGVEEEIVEGVEQMQVIYGVDSNNNHEADTFMTATQVNNSNNWNNVISLQVRLLMSTIEAVGQKPTAFTFNGATLTPLDRQLRRQWQIFVTLRNRGLPS